MNFDEYWKALTAKNPLLSGSKRLTVSPEKMKAMIQQAHNEGFDHGKKTVAPLYDHIFGKK